MPIKIQEIRSRDEFVALQVEWTNLLERSEYDAPFVTHQWIATWWKYFAGDQQVSVIIGRESGRLVLALPMLEPKHGASPFKTLQSMTNSHSFRFNLLSETGRDDLLSELWHYLGQRPGWHLLKLTDVPMDVATTDRLVKHIRNDNGFVGIWHAMESAYIQPSGQWKEHESKISKSVRKRLRNQRNRLERDGKVDLEVLTDPDQIAAALPEAFEIERRGWKGDKGSAIACDPNRLGFYTELASVSADAGWTRLSFLRVGDERAAFEFALEYKNRFHSIKIGFDAEKFEKSSAGRLLVMDSLVRSFDNGIAEYDFVGPMTTAHAEWKPDTREIGWLFIYRKSLLGFLHYKMKFSLIPFAKRRLGR